MLSIPGTEALSPAVKYVIAFAIIFVLLALFALVLRRLTGGRLSMPANDRRTRQPRLGIVDVYDLDRQRQLILLRRDNVEHLLLIGGPNDVIVETNIVRTPGARLPSATIEPNADRPEAVFERSLEAPSRPLVEPTQRPEPVVARLGPTDPTRAGAEQPVRNGPAAMQTEPYLKPDVVALSPAAPAMAPRPAPQPVRAVPQPPPPPQVMREPPPPPVREPPPPPVREVPPPPPQRAVKPPPQPREPAPPPPPEPPPAVRAAPEPRPRQAPPPPQPARAKDHTVADAAVLSDMAKQLEEALKRPLSSGKQGAGSPPQNGPVPHVEERPPRAAPASPGRAPPPAAAPPPLRPAEPPRPRPVPASMPRVHAAPEPEPEPRNAGRAPSPPAQPAPPAAAEQVDPFSVEEIEAEFARLLGRPIDRGDRPH